MNKREALDTVNQHLASVLGPAFALRRSYDGAFVRPFAGGLDLLFVGFWGYPPHFVFAVTPAVRLDAVGKLCHRVFDTEFKAPTTVSTHLWRLDGPARPAVDVPLPNSGSPYYLTFTDADSARQAVEQLQPRLLNKVFP